jgi:hypothetical protein
MTYFLLVTQKIHEIVHRPTYLYVCPECKGHKYQYRYERYAVDLRTHWIDIL